MNILTKYFFTLQLIQKIWCVCVKWAEGGFKIQFNRFVLHLFFFFFFEFRPIQPIWPIPSDTGPNRPDSEPRRCESTRVGFKKMKATWHDAAGRAGSGVPRVLPRPTASDAGAAPLVPRPCFTGYQSAKQRQL